MENARISDELDFAVISGWESTAIENHSGIVDNLRNFKSDPKLIAGSLLPVRPIAKQRALCIEQGKPATFDLYPRQRHAANRRLATHLHCMITPSGKPQELITLPAPTHDVGSVQLSAQGRLRYTAAHRRRTVPLQVCAVVSAAQHADERDLGTQLNHFG
jgi:hypothetical protein